MIVCPFCDSENIEGADICESCGQGLAHLHLTPPASKLETDLLKGRVRDLNPKTPIAVATDSSVRKVIELLVNNNIGCVFVTDGNAITGVFSERDALTRIGTDYDEVADCPISQFMTCNPQSLDPDAKIAFGIRMMDLGGYRHVPVVGSDGEPQGVISVRDILRFFSEVAAA